MKMRAFATCIIAFISKDTFIRRSHHYCENETRPVFSTTIHEIAENLIFFFLPPKKDNGPSKYRDQNVIWKCNHFKQI